MPLEVDGWNSNPDLIGTLGGQDVAEGSLPKYLNNAVRYLASAINAFRNKAYCKDKNVTIQASGGAAPASPQDGDLWIEYTP